jgi:cytochrome c oxidase cbb3-type subunit III
LRLSIKFVALFSVTLFFLLVGTVYAAHDEIPRITIEELKKLIDAKADVVILDVQLKSTYDKGHIKGALSFPWTAELTDGQARRLPRNKPIITYCDCGPGETDSASMAAQLIDLGFADVKILKDPSIRGWKKAGLPTE